jgi:hypothetical protein
MKLINFFKFEYNSIVNRIKFYYAKRKADKLHLLTGKQYHILPVGTKLMVVDNTMVKVINQRIKVTKGVNIGKIDIRGLSKMSYYSTGTGTLRAR